MRRFGLQLLLTIASLAGLLSPACPAAAADASKSINQFGIALYDQLRGREGNVFFSPYSIYVALGMTYAGARTETAQEMARVLHAEGAPTDEAWHGALAALQQTLEQAPGVTLHVSNALWGQKDYKFLEPFLQLVAKFYEGGIQQLDFKGQTEQARQTINDWVAEQTMQKILNLIPDGALDPLTRLVLTNAVYFKGRWLSQFDKAKTQEQPFTLLSGTAVPVPMMAQALQAAYAEDDLAQIVELPYEGEALSMVLIVPKASGGIGTVEAQLSADQWAAWRAALSRQAVDVSLPQFKKTINSSLVRQLAALGMHSAFSSKADFSGMDGTRDLFIDKVLHKAFVEVNEEGTEAAAATAITIVLATALPREPAVVVADHPFLFAIQHAPTGAILFLGRIVDPRGEQ